jgi:hypothetical protein
LHIGHYIHGERVPVTHWIGGLEVRYWAGRGGEETTIYRSQESSLGCPHRSLHTIVNELPRPQLDTRNLSADTAIRAQSIGQNLNTGISVFLIYETGIPVF